MHPAREELTARLIAIEKERHVVLTGEAEEIAANFVRLKEIAKDADDEAERMKSALNLAMDQHGVPRPGKAIAGAEVDGIHTTGQTAGRKNCSRIGPQCFPPRRVWHAGALKKSWKCI